MLLLILLQVVLPIGLIVWLACAPAKNFIGYIVQAVATGLTVLALALVALWMLLPWWLPFAYALLCLLAIAYRAWRHGFNFPSRQPTTLSEWIVLATLIALGSLGAILSWQGIQGRQLPAVGVVDIPPPLGPGTYLVANGGSREAVNGHMKTLDPTVERLRAYRGQSYGLDLIKIDRLGLRARGLWPQDPAAYDIYGEPVYSPCDGDVIASRNDRPDMPVPVMDRQVIEGNHVLLRCNDVMLLLAHFQPGSVRVDVGDRVRVGTHLGAVGNSGNTAEPHLHISAQREGSRAEPLSGNPLAIVIDGRYLVRNDRLYIGPP
ncbi:MAG: M23 family metallopeptidase [Woeseiaceae bacterium]